LTLKNSGHDIIEGVSTSDHLKHVGLADEAEVIDQFQTTHNAAAFRHADKLKVEATALENARNHKNENLDAYVELAKGLAEADGKYINTAEHIAERKAKDENRDELMDEANAMAAAEGVTVVTNEMLAAEKKQKAVEALDELELSDDMREGLNYLKSLEGIQFKIVKDAEKGLVPDQKDVEDVAKILEKFKEAGFKPSSWMREVEARTTGSTPSGFGTRVMEISLGVLAKHGRVNGPIAKDVASWNQSYGRGYEPGEGKGKADHRSY
jgi:hypothetical protein